MDATRRTLVALREAMLTPGMAGLFRIIRLLTPESASYRKHALGGAQPHRERPNDDQADCV